MNGLLWLAVNTLVPALLVFLLLGALFGFVLGVSLIARAGPTLAWIHYMNRWVSTRRALRPLEVPRQVGLHSRASQIFLGGFLAAGGLFTFWFLLARLELPRLATVVGVELQRWLAAAIVLQTLKWFLVAGSVLAIAVGVLLIGFPARLARIELASNRWFSTRKLVPPAGDNLDLRLERLVQRHPRAAGWAIALACLLVALSTGLLLAGRP